jgi:hypothetical protein
MVGEESVKGFCERSQRWSAGVWLVHRICCGANAPPALTLSSTFKFLPSFSFLLLVRRIYTIQVSSESLDWLIGTLNSYFYNS